MADFRDRSRLSRRKLSRAATWAFIGMSFFGGFIGGGEWQKVRTPPQPDIVLMVQSPQDIHNLTIEVTRILQNAADKKITVEEAVLQISSAFKISISNMDVVGRIRVIVERAVTAATSVAVQTETANALKILEETAKPTPSPTPTQTIVIPRR